MGEFEREFAAHLVDLHLMESEWILAIRAVLVESGPINESDVQPILRVAGVAELLDRFREVDEAS